MHRQTFHVVPSINEITVLFALPGQEADDVIETLIREHSASRRLTVVSSDHRLQTAIRRRRGIPLDSDVFLKQLESPQREMNVPMSSTPSVNRPESELNFWMQEFNAIQPEELRKEIDALGSKKSDWQQGIEQLEQRIQNPDDLEAWLNEVDRRQAPSQTEDHRPKQRRPKQP